MHRRTPSKPFALLAICTLTACSDLGPIAPSLSNQLAGVSSSRRFDPTRGAKDAPGKPNAPADTTTKPAPDTTVASAPTAPTPVAPTPVDTSLASPTTAAAPTTGFAVEPTLPAELALPTDAVVTGRTWRPTTADELRRIVESDARPGDQILLAPGVSYVGYLYLPPRTGSGWITVRTDLPASELPAPGERATTAHATRFAKIVSHGRNDPAVLARNGAGGWRFIGVEFAASADSRDLNSLVALGWGDATSLAETPTDFVFDRVVMRAHSLVSMYRCVLLNSGRTAIVNSTFECHGNFADAMAIGGIAGPGPYRIENNSIAGSGHGVLFGGADPRIQNLSPSDIVVRNNRIWKPDSWKGVYQAKTLLELKHARRVLIEGNVFENHWSDAQTGFALLFKSVNQDGAAPWSQTTDVTVRRNILRNSAAGINIAARPEGHPTVPAARIKVEGNLLYEIGTYAGTTNGRLVMLSGPLSDVQVVGNTMVHNQAALAALTFGNDEVTARPQRLVVRNNISTAGEYGWFGNWSGTRALTWYADSAWRADGNVLIGASNAWVGLTGYPDGTRFATTVSAVGFANPAAGDFSLLSSSAFQSAGASGSMPGVNMRELLGATVLARAMQ
jgi:hypothetical protein